MTAWEDFLLDVLKIAVAVWFVAAVLFAVVFAPRGRR